MREKRVPFSKYAHVVQIIHQYIIKGLLHDHTINRRSLNYFYYLLKRLSLCISL